MIVQTWRCWGTITICLLATAGASNASAQVEAVDPPPAAPMADFRVPARCPPLENRQSFRWSCVLRK